MFNVFDPAVPDTDVLYPRRFRLADDADTPSIGLGPVGSPHLSGWPAIARIFIKDIPYIHLVQDDAFGPLTGGGCHQASAPHGGFIVLYPIPIAPYCQNTNANAFTILSKTSVRRAFCIDRRRLITIAAAAR